MNIYNAILKAADHIERNPAEFLFLSTDIPKAPGCGTPGCALGWIGYYAGYNGRILKMARDLLGIDHPEHIQHPFYLRMNELTGNAWTWRVNAAECSRGLRLYAEKYHGEQKPKPATPPDWNAMSAKWTVSDDVRSQEVAA